jgi:hypothetical protein
VRQKPTPATPIAIRRGKKRALVAVGHTILASVWHLLTHDAEYADLGAGYFLQRAGRAPDAAPGQPAQHARPSVVPPISGTGLNCDVGGFSNQTPDDLTVRRHAIAGNRPKTHRRPAEASLEKHRRAEDGRAPAAVKDAPP